MSNSNEAQAINILSKSLVTGAFYGEEDGLSMAELFDQVTNDPDYGVICDMPSDPKDVSELCKDTQFGFKVELESFASKLLEGIAKLQLEGRMPLTEDKLKKLSIDDLLDAAVGNFGPHLPPTRMAVCSWEESCQIYSIEASCSDEDVKQAVLEDVYAGEESLMNSDVNSVNVFRTAGIPIID